MVNHEYRCIFIEVPKTASTSVRKVLGQPGTPHLDILQIRDEVPPEIFESYFKFGFVRNPWDRVVSLYQRKKVHGQATFADFVHWIRNASDTCRYPREHENQLDWFTDENGEVIVDYIGKFETLAEDWSKIRRRIGCESKLPHANAKPHKYYSSYYTPELVEVIRRKFRTDIEYFDYSFVPEVPQSPIAYFWRRIAARLADTAGV